MSVNAKGRKELTLNERKAGFAMLVMACKDGELPKGSFVRAAAASRVHPATIRCLWRATLSNMEVHLEAIDYLQTAVHLGTG